VLDVVASMTLALCLLFLTGLLVNLPKDSLPGSAGR
jgi:hypothetical protein